MELTEKEYVKRIQELHELNKKITKLEAELKNQTEIIEEYRKTFVGIDFTPSLLDIPDNVKVVITNERLDGNIFADRKDCWDKLGKCPVVLPFPSGLDNDEYDKINAALKWLTTDEAYKASNEYDFDKWITKYDDIK